MHTPAGDNELHIAAVGFVDMVGVVVLAVVWAVPLVWGSSALVWSDVGVCWVVAVLVLAGALFVVVLEGLEEGLSTG